MTTPPNSFPILQIKNLKTYFYTRQGIVKAVDDISFNVEKGKVLGLVGESGSGKSMTSLSVLRLVPPPGKIISGEILFENQSLLALSNEEMRKRRGKEISMIFQEPMTSLNPVFTVGEQVAEMVRLHLKMNRKEAKEKTIELFKWVGISSEDKRYHEYPHQLSGGMRQRVMIAMAISCNPKIIFADEPTTALDVTIQAQILNLLQHLKEKLNMSLVLISHDLGIIAETADEVAVMYAGKIVEYVKTQTLFANPLHPYTQGLLESLPKFDQNGRGKTRLKAISGVVPKLSELPPGCAFEPRCPYAMEICKTDPPKLEEKEDGHWGSCWLEKKT
ncbi:MAG: ABC transporter ATP-binding protein [Nitrospirae bacterium]|nr:ABC transporter ATP-binding protein [Nitrospirota bacterium]MBI3352726.1 ABC transporter ATP-binding protein [Nitrospirota bacterium]